MPIFTIFATTMQKRLIVITFLAVFLCCAYAQDKEIIYVLHQGKWMAADIHNIDTLAFENGKLKLNSRGNICRTSFDSLVFTPPAKPATPIGWWGDIHHGTSKGYFHNDDSLHADVEMNASDSICQSAFILIDDSIMTGLDTTPQKVGRKWRYTKGTLTRRRQFSFCSSSYMPYGKAKNEDPVDSGDTYKEIDFSLLFNNHRTDETCQVFNIWFQPEEEHSAPTKPVFGTFYNSLYSETEYYDFEECANAYNLTLEDNISISIRLEMQDEKTVTGDTMSIVFNNAEEAFEEFMQMDTHGDGYTNFFLAENVITIVEHFNATYQEVVAWLTRFDIDLCKPLFLRDE